ncbi:uncharacterized protein LOC113506560 [Trichoplusia ni]|uniref:Uncharacterized protein LOC113506560 n=1 Tax=Trichoplusia ni TaxID=7111 RepID=A0A7E5WY36_TRINI|nr:uncharacterized protein LOC113506560 [Trichoplusia ni]
MSKQVASHLFSSEDEAELQEQQHQKSNKASGSSKSSAPVKRLVEGQSSKTEDKKKRKKSYIHPISLCMKPTSYEVFGTDSDDDREEEAVGSTQGKKNPPLFSYFTRRVANGLSRQTDEKKTGRHYVELKNYDCAEIERIALINRWRHSIIIITLKNRTDDGTPAWQHFKEFINKTRQEFKQSL